MRTISLKLPGSDDFFTQEAYKVLRTNIQFCGQDVRVILLTSCDENEGKTVVSLHIAKSFAELGKRVLVIDADMRKSVMAGRNTDAKDFGGLSEVLTGMSEIGDCLCVTKNEKLNILFAGKYPPNPVELLNGKHFAKLIEESRKSFDYIFVDAPPLGRVIDAAVIASHCDGAILVLGSERVHLRRAQVVVDQLQKSGCRILGAVHNDFRRKRHARYYYYSKRRYSRYAKYSYSSSLPAPSGSKYSK